MTQVHKRVSLLLTGLMVLGLCSIAIGQEGLSDGEKAKLAEQKRTMLRYIKKELNNTTWDITLTESGAGEKRKTIEDTLRFVNGKIESEMLVSKGFSPTNFTVRVKRETKVIWETMQKAAEEGLAFWRGELKRDEDGNLSTTMRGVLSRHLNDKKQTVEDYTFRSEDMAEITPEADEGAIEETPTAVKEAPEPKVEEVKKEPEKAEPEAKKEEEKPKKKKWWWQK